MVHILLKLQTSKLYTKEARQSDNWWKQKLCDCGKQQLLELLLPQQLLIPLAIALPCFSFLSPTGTWAVAA
jgi:hypothetical protein